MAGKKYANDPKEVEALRQGHRYMLPGISPHGVRMLVTMMANALDGDDLQSVLDNFLADIQGEGPFMQCFLAMLNSRNCIEREPVDFERLNKARFKRGKPALMNYTKTKLVLSRAQARVADADGMSRETARQHLVRGHFKIRTSRKGGGGVFWWSPHLRGDGRRGTMKRAEYEVVTE